MALEALVACNTSSEKGKFLLALLPEIILRLEDDWLQINSEWGTGEDQLEDDELINTLKRIQNGS